MTIRPVILNGVIQRTDDIGQLKQHEDAKPFVDQQNIQMQVKREEQHNLKQVNRTEDSQFMDERFDAKEEGKNSYHGNHSKRKKKAKTPDGKVRSKNQPGSFDIKI